MSLQGLNLNCDIWILLGFVDYIEYRELQGGKGVKGPSEQIFYLMACYLKILI